MRKCILLIFLLFVLNEYGTAQTNFYTQKNITTVGLGWAGNSINAVVFRKNSLVSFKNTQFISYYDAEGVVIIGKRDLKDTAWQLQKTIYRGNVNDAHNSISIGIDGDGYLHLAWDHHNTTLKYCKSITPLSMQFGPIISMVGDEENKVSYPEFYTMPDGNLLFFYRDGGSGNGNMIINKYFVKQKKWQRLQNNLIDGEGKRNAYWQACVDVKGRIHISWVWRESPDVASNHDLCYAISGDGGITWQRSTGEKYQLPITITSAQIIITIPPYSELINQTSMYADESKNVYIASYWKDKNDVPQYHVVYQINNKWKVNNLGFRKTTFTLNGAGTKKIPISRPQIVSWKKGTQKNVALIFRDEERGNKVSIASTKNIQNNKWLLQDIYTGDTGAWEPSYDTELWKNKQQLHLFVQHVTQADAEGVIKTPAQLIHVIAHSF